MRLLPLVLLFLCACDSAPKSTRTGMVQACPDTGILSIGDPPPEGECPTDPPPMQEVHVQLDVAGLWTNPNSVGGTRKPAGALLRADNLTSNRPGEAEPVKGFTRKAYALPEGVSAAALFEYSGTEFAWGSNGTLYHDNGTAYVSNGSAPDLSGEVLKHVTAGGDLYVTTATGLLMADGITGTLRIPGAPRAYDIISEGVFSTASADSPWLPAGNSVAYRSVWGRLDSEGRPVLGEPSGRVVATATVTGGPYSPVVTILIPPEVTSAQGYFIRLYRTAPIIPGSDPGDMMFLVYERALTASDDASGEINLTDVDSQGGGEPLFTNSDRGGQSNNHNRPPIAHDLTTYANRMWLANTQDRQRVELRIIAPAPSGGARLWVGTENYLMFGDLTGGTVSQEIEAQARAVVRDINDISTAYVAYYTSGLYDPPGKFVIERRGLADAAFAVQTKSNTGVPNAAWAATITPNLFAPYSSVADIYPNRVMYSLDGLPYAFPTTNTLAVGAEESAVLRIQALRDSLFVFKEDGLWKITGRGPFYVEQINATCRLIAPESIAVVDNTIFAITDGGVVAVSEGGVETISIPIDDVFKALTTVALDQTRVHTRVVAREANTELKVYFAVPTDEDSEYADQTFEWNAATETWWRRPYGFPAGYTDRFGRLILAPYAEDVDNAVRVERSTGGNADYVTDESDPEGSATTTIAGLTSRGVLVPNTTVLHAGEVLVDPTSPNRSAGITEVLPYAGGFWELVLNRTGVFITPDEEVDLRLGVQVDIEWNTEVGSSPSIMKQWTQTSVLFQERHYGPFPMTYIGDGYESQYGTQQAFAENEPFVRAEVPFDLQRSSKLNIRMQREVPGEYMRLLGMDAIYRTYGTAASSLKR